MNTHSVQASEQMSKRDGIEFGKEACFKENEVFIAKHIHGIQCLKLENF